MPSTKKNTFIGLLLWADIRFTPPYVWNDHCWEVCSSSGQPPSMSGATTYGLRASQMQVFPSFSLVDQVVRDPAQFFSQPEIQYYSTNFIALSFSPFQGIDVIYNIWVPNSQILMGEILFHNRTSETHTLGVEWQVNLAPLQEGSPMKHVQSGLTTVLQGECGGIFPVFYLPGDVIPSTSSTPGLAGKYLLMPFSGKQITWALASLSSPEASFQQARQYSSKTLDVEKLRIEMADKREMMIFSSDDKVIAQAMQLSRIRALQLVMPPQGNFPHPTFITARGVDKGYHSQADQIGINPEWSGQTLADIWLIMQTLLPGQANEIKGFIENSLSRQSENGRVDHRLSAGGAQTGHNALPMLARLVAELHPHLNDVPWLEDIYPRLMSSLRSWLDFEPGGQPRVKGLTHPAQIGVSLCDEKDSQFASNLWIGFHTNSNFFILTLLIREITYLLQISRWLQRHEEIEWLDSTRKKLLSKAMQLWDGKRGVFHKPVSSEGQIRAGTVIHVYKRNGSYKPKQKLPFAEKLYMRVTGEIRLTSGFSCAIKGLNGDVPLEITVRQPDTLAIGSSRVFVSEQEFTFIESVEIKGLPTGLSIEIGQPSDEQPGIIQLLSLYAGLLTPREADLMLRNIRVRDYFGEEGVTMLPAKENNQALFVPSNMLGMIIEGLLDYAKVRLAEQVFDHHFFTQRTNKRELSQRLMNTAQWSVEDLVPARLFLKIRGVVMFTNREVILSHFIKQKKDSVTVQYNKIELRLNPYLTEIHTQTGEVIYLNRAGPNKILLE